MRLEVLHVRDCPNLPVMLDRLAQVTDLPIVTRLIETPADAQRFGLTGSPTLLIDGVDPFATAGEAGLSCRIYRDPGGQRVDVPTVEQFRSALGAGDPSEVLSAWRTRALPLEPTERAAHRAILCTFAETGRPPAPAELDTGDRSPSEVLTALHDLDAIRLTSYGEIAVAYPFSATPTRHRVRISDRVDVYSMCAIDALGIAPMLRENTVIESVDVTNRRHVKVVTTGGQTTWEPCDAVVFVGADVGGGPSADCCCDYLNFFTDPETAQTWRSAHPGVPGRILDQPHAEALATNLFAHLLIVTADDD